MRRKKRHLNLKKVGLLLVLIILIIGLTYYQFIFKNNNNKSNNDNTDIVNKDDDKPKKYSLDMVMVGDALIHGSVYNDAKVGNTYDFSPMFSEVSDYFKSFDLAFYNQETPFAGKSIPYQGYPTFNTPSEIGDDMLEMGFNLVSLATNHTMDMGASGALNSLAYWNSKENILAVGSYASQEDRDKVIIKEKNGIKYALLAYTTSTNLKVPSDKQYLLNMYDKEKVKADIEKVRDKVDFLMVSMHWGTEYATKPNAQQKEIAAYLASLGVDLVIGHHTHSVQPIEYIDGTLVIYSLGNFISGQLDNDKLTGLMVSLKVNKTVEDGKTTMNLSDLEANLIYTYYEGAKNMTSVHKNHKVIPYSKLTTKFFPDYVSYYSKYKSILTSIDATIPVASLDE